MRITCRNQQRALSAAAVAMLAALLLLAAGCGSDSPEDTSIASYMRGRNEAASMYLGPARTYTEMMPIVEYRDYETGETTKGFVDSFVVGDIADVSEGRYFTSQDKDDSKPESSEVAPEDASWATIHVTVEPTFFADASGKKTPPEEVVFGLVAAPGKVAQFMKDVAGFGTVSVLLAEQSSVFDYQPGINAVLANGMFLGVVSDGGDVIFPFVGSSGRESFALDDVTIDGSMSAATAPASFDVVVLAPAAVYRVDEPETLEANGINLADLIPFDANE